MSRDYPDFWFGDWGGDREVLQDMGELAARLGSPFIFSRTGQVAHYWDGKRGFSGMYNLEGTADVISLDANVSFLSGYSLKMTPSNSSPTNYALASINCQPYALDKYGLEVGIGISGAYEKFELVLGVLEDGIYYYSAIKHTDADNKWYYYSSAGSWVEFLTFALQDADPAYLNFIKLVVDFSTHEYVRFEYGNDFYDLSGIAIDDSNSASEDTMAGGLWVYNGAAQTGSIYLTHMLITTGEA